MNALQLTQLPLFKNITEAEAQRLLSEASNSIRKYSSGDFIARQGDSCRSLYILYSGDVRTQMENADGKQLTIDVIHAPDILAPAFIYADENRFPVNVEAITKCEVLVMDKTRFLRFMHEVPSVMQNFIALISNRSLFLSRKLNEFALQSLKIRLLNYLQIHKRISNQQEVAFILGVARPSLARALSELISEGTIVMKGKEVLIKD
ncbi:Crp/Fnr family transcriptional regulator [uncultured Bacteroides sp.]|uniref:Crp/Fnr family transcriptional regulator n=1 Tax=uncultured Bacteroides sp. TaxID=162156 RepID=UPI00263828ED|nr:Crp/Fnr family transcriptional regulator [uncultured Bacteroides sp.]